MRISDWSSDVCSSDLSSFLSLSIARSSLHQGSRRSGKVFILLHVFAGVGHVDRHRDALPASGPFLDRIQPAAQMRQSFARHAGPIVGATQDTGGNTGDRKYGPGPHPPTTDGRSK